MQLTKVVTEGQTVGFIDKKHGRCWQWAITLHQADPEVPHKTWQGKQETKTKALRSLNDAVHSLIGRIKLIIQQ